MSNNRLKIFIVEDLVTWQEALKEHLGPNFDYTICNTGEECLAQIDKKPDLIILDHEFDKAGGTLNGLDVLKAVKKKYPDIHVIMFSAQENIQTAVELFENGAYDYVVKGDHAKYKVKHFIKRILDEADHKTMVVSLNVEIQKWKVALIAVVIGLSLMLLYIYFTTCPHLRMIQFDPFGVANSGNCPQTIAPK